MPLEILADGAQSGRTRLHRVPAFTPLQLTNRTGVDLVEGDVVALSIVNENSVTLSDLILTRGIYVVAVADVASGASGSFAIQGTVLVRASGTVALGEYVQKSATALSVDGLGQTRINGTPQLPPPSLALGHAVEASSGGFVRCYWYGSPAPGLSIANLVEFYEDFESTNATFAGGGIGAAEQWKYAWFRCSGADANSRYGVMRLQGDANAPFFRLSAGGGLFATPFSTADGPLVLEMRFAQRGAAAGTRRLGLSGVAITTADPVDGMFVRFALDGTIFAVCRAAGVETVVDCGIFSTTDSMDTVAMVYDFTAVYVLANGARVGAPITTNIPTVALGPSGGNSTGTAGTGFDLDAIRVLAPRSPFS